MNSFLLDPYQYRGLSVNRLLRMKLRTLSKFLVRWLTHPVRRRTRLRTLASIRGMGESRRALVLGLGPTINSIDPLRVRSLQDRGELDVVVVNAYYRTSLAGGVVPDYYVMTDPAYFAQDASHYVSTSRANPMDAWEYIAANPSIRVVIPDDREHPHSISTDRVYYINSLGLEGFSRNVRPSRPRGYLSITAFAALAIAGHLGYERIYLAGVENSQFRSLALTAEGKVGLRGHHAYSQGDSEVRAISIWANAGIAGFFEDVSRLFGDLHLFRGLPIFNVDTSTLIDAFPIATDEERAMVCAPSTT